MNIVVITLSFLLFSMSSAECMQYEPDEETDRFRNEVSTSYIFKGYMGLSEAPNRTRQINELSTTFPDFQVINNHFSCNACHKGGSEFLQALDQGQTLNTLSSICKAELSDCWYKGHNCMDYAFYTLVIEQHPDKISTLKYLMKEGIYSFFKIAGLEEVENPEEAHVVIYPDGCHYGIYRGNGIVESKWGGMRAVFRHKLWYVPNSYCNRITFHKVVFLKPEVEVDYWIDSAQNSCKNHQ